MMKVRPNIIHRRIRERPDQVLLENLDKEYKQQLKQDEARRQRREALIGERRKDLFATPEEKAELVQKSKALRETLERAKQEQEATMANRDRWVAIDVERHNMLTQEMEDMEMAARRAYMRNLCQENLKLAEYRRRMRSEAIEREKERERIAGDFYERWGRNAFN